MVSICYQRQAAMNSRIETLRAITLKVVSIEVSVRFYRDVLGMELVYGGPQLSFCSLVSPGTEFPILNLQQGAPAGDWGRIIFHVTDVDAFWQRLEEEGFKPDHPENAPWGERYFHVHDPDGHELSFARPL
jgi:catechol 2,3-dioxygenase-like lactoylglutathione lyase family enzyme